MWAMTITYFVVYALLRFVTVSSAKSTYYSSVGTPETETTDEAIHTALDEVVIGTTAVAGNNKKNVSGI